MRQFGKLSAARVAQANKPGRYGDGNGLILQVSRFGTKSWLLRYQLGGRERWMGLGSLSDVSLKDARVKAREAHSKLIDGDDPIDVRRAKKAAVKADAARAVTFRQAAERYIATHKAKWKNGKHAEQWTATLATYAAPVIGDLDVRDIDVGHILKVLEPIWARKQVTARRVRQRIENVLDWATARKYRQGDNPARWRGFLDKLLPDLGHKVEHQAALPYKEMPEFMAELRDNSVISARALELTILTACRTSEVINANWSEFELDRSVWVVPGERTKSGREHRVPLSERALAILKGLPRVKGNEFVFPGVAAKKPLSNMAMLELLRGLRPGITVHGFRSTFRDWVAERTGYPNIVAEMALAHVIGDKVEAAYRRGDLFEKRRRLMRDWAGYCAQSRSGQVIAIRAASSLP